MGFPSPAKDYVEQRLTVELLCGINANSHVVETSSGYAVIDRSLKCDQGNVVLIRYDGRSEFAKIMGKAFITEDGEAIEGEALDDVTVMGRVTFFIHSTRRNDDDGLVM